MLLLRIGDVGLLRGGLCRLLIPRRDIAAACMYICARGVKIPAAGGARHVNARPARLLRAGWAVGAACR